MFQPFIGVGSQIDRFLASLTLKLSGKSLFIRGRVALSVSIDHETQGLTSEPERQNVRMARKSDVS